MNEAMILKLAKDALEMTLMVSGPLLIVSLVIGILVSVAQVVTSIQDMTLSFVPRILAVFLTFLFALVTPGIIEMNAGTVGGPVLWFLAIAISPFGLPSLRTEA